jgi:hypothetical protein
MSTKWTGLDIRELISDRTNDFALLAQQRMPISEAHKFLVFKESLAGIGQLDDLFHDYMIANPKPATISFAAIAALVQASVDARPIVHVARSIFNAAAVVDTTPTKREKRDKKTTKETKEPIYKAPASYNKYCYSHGSNCNHSSADCKHQEVGHASDATEGDKKGGKATPYIPYWFNK